MALITDPVGIPDMAIGCELIVRCLAGKKQCPAFRICRGSGAATR
jgi:hypothetical protein